VLKEKLLLHIANVHCGCYDMGMTTKQTNTSAGADLRGAIARSGRPGRAIERDAGLAGGTVTRYVRGQRDLTLERAERLAATIGYTLRLVRQRKPRTKGR